VFLGPNGSAEYKDNKADWTQGELRNLGPGWWDEFVKKMPKM
jgi:hypothetical protein